jgi:NADPH:quinone reductase-like Zn-dependent oxidoreductase
MKAIYYTRYGAPEVLHIKEVDKPVPRNNELLIKVKATAVNAADWRFRKADPFAIRFFLGLTKPKLHILGGVLSGEVEAIGNDVRQFKVGDEVFGSTSMNVGAYAEYICSPENAVLAHKPKNITHQQAAVIPFGGTTALYFLRKATIKSGQKVLVYGASGAVGTAAIQLAKHFGANVTGVCSSANFELIKSLGAGQAIDYTQKDFTTNGERYDVIFETVNKMSVSRCLGSLQENGTLILSAAALPQMLQGIWASKTGTKKVLMGMITQKVEDLVFLKELIETGNTRH